jgi:hypothetical protein
MIRKRSVILSVLFLSVGAAFAGTLWNAGGANLRSQLVPGSSIAIDDGDPGFSTTGQGWQRFQHALGTKGDLLSPASILDPSLSATWTFSRVQPGQYRVFVTYKAYSLLTNQAPYTVKDGSRVLSQTTVNQRADPAGNTFDGRNWALLGTYTFQGPTVSVTLKRPQGLTVNGVIADAARVELVSAAPAWAAAGGSAASSTVRMGSPTGGYSASFPAAGYTSAAAGGTGQPEGGTTPESGGMPVTGLYQP